MIRWRRMTLAALTLTYLQLVLGGIVRISGSGMGCGDHWPRCNGSWIPPFTDPTVMIEWTHRLVAALVSLAIVSVLGAVWALRTQPGIGGRGGLLRPVTLAAVLVVATALLGAVTVKLGNTAFATVAHWTLAMTLLGVLATAAVRAGAFGADRARSEGGTPRAFRSLTAGAALAFVVVVMGALVAKVPGAAAACPSFPTCGAPPGGDSTTARDIQIGHRMLAFILAFHTVAVASAIRRRAGESAVVRSAAATGAGLALLQVGFGAAMVLTSLHPAWRGAHEAVGVAVWLTMFTAAYLARSASRVTAVAA